jgi:uncharacterized membrane protein
LKTPEPRKKIAFDKPDLLALSVCLLALIFWIGLLFKKFVCFGYDDWDLAMYAQAVWALTQGSIKSSIFGTSFLANHAEYIAFFIAPLYKIFPSAFTLIVLKAFAFTSGAFVFYLITKHLLDWRMGLTFMLLYLVHPANFLMMIYEFHFENLAIPFVFLMFYFHLKQRLIPFLICTFFATIIKENISLVVMMFGFYALLQRKPLRSPWVAVPVLLGGLFFVINIFIIMPQLKLHDGLASTNLYAEVYRNSSLWDNMSNFTARSYFNDLFTPFTILPIFSPSVLFLGAPIFLQQFLSPYPGMKTFFFHYAATAIIFIFLATVTSLSKFRKNGRILFYFGIIILTVVGNGLLIKKFLPEFRKDSADWKDVLDPQRQRMTDQIPPKASIIASFSFLDKLANRENLYSIHNFWKDQMTFTKGTFPKNKHFDFALIDWNSQWLWADLTTSAGQEEQIHLKRINEFYFSRGWKTVYSANDITLLSSIKGDLPPLVENSPTLFTGITAMDSDIIISEHLKLIHFEIKAPSPTTTELLPLVFVWQSQKTTKEFFAVDLKVLRDDKVILEKIHPLGYTFNGTPVWKEGQYVKENYNLMLSSLAPSEYTLKISFLNINKNKPEPIVFNGQEVDALKFNFCYLCQNQATTKNLP